MTDTLKLKSILLLNGYRQKDLADYLHISYQAINLKINNKRQFKLDEIAKICEFLNILDVQEKFSIFFAVKVDKNFMWYISN